MSPEQGTEGKWAEDSKSEASSIDEFDIISMRGRKIKLPSSSQQNGGTSEDIEDGKKEDKLGEGSLEKDRENDNKENEKLVENSTDKEQESKESENEEKMKKAGEGLGEQIDTATETTRLNTTDSHITKDQIKKPSSPKPHKKAKSIRFKDEINAKKSNKVDKTKEKDGKSGEENQEDKTDHVNPYLDEWLGVKKKEVDGRYKPGKPPPNR